MNTVLYLLLLGDRVAIELTILEEKAFSRLCVSALPEQWTGQSEEAGSISQLYFLNVFLNCIFQMYFSTEKTFSRLCIIALPEQWTGHSEEAGTSLLSLFILYEDE